jgi:hypothetical protein
MHGVHLICKRRGVGLIGLSYDRVSNRYTSGSWSFTKNEAESLIGGKILLHQAKSSSSTMGGTVEAFHGPDEDGRVSFVFRSEAECRGKPWRGRDYGMAWTGGIIEVES